MPQLTHLKFASLFKSCSFQIGNWTNPI